MCIELPDWTGGGDDRPRLLVVDDDAEMRSLLVEVLVPEGYRVVEAANGAEALIRLRNESFAAIILDKNMPGLSGLDLLPGMGVICPETPVVLITAYGDVSTYMEAMEKGAFEYVFKPFRMEEVPRTAGSRREVPNGGRQHAPCPPVAPGISRA